jgi:hypothetical protein
MAQIWLLGARVSCGPLSVEAGPAYAAVCLPPGKLSAVRLPFGDSAPRWLGASRLLGIRAD